MEEFEKFFIKDKSDTKVEWLLGIAFIVFGVFSFYDEHYFRFILLITAGFFIIYLAIFGKNNTHKWLENLSMTGLLEELVEDFKSSSSYNGDELKIGSKYIFRKKNTDIITIDTIISLRVMYSTEQNNGKFVRILVELINGKQTLVVELKDDLSSEASSIIEDLKSKRPNLLYSDNI